METPSDEYRSSDASSDSHRGSDTLYDHKSAVIERDGDELIVANDYMELSMSEDTLVDGINGLQDTDEVSVGGFDFIEFTDGSVIIGPEGETAPIPGGGIALELDVIREEMGL